MTRIGFFLSTSGHSGVDRLAQNLLPALVRRGYAVDLLKVRRHGPELPADCGVNLIDLGTAHTYSALPAVVSYLRRYRPDVVFSDKDRVNRTALFAHWIAQTNVRLVFSQGTTISVDLAHRGAFERWLQRNSIGRLYRFAERLIVTSAGVAEDIHHYTGLDPGHIDVVPCPVVPASWFDTQPVRPDHPWFADGEPPVILGVGELGMRKDFPTLIRAFARLRKRRPARLVILGRGGERDALLALAADLGISADVQLPGYVNNVQAYMAHAAAFAITSQWEGLGFVLIEALASGTASVATDCPSGPREILADGRYGPLVAVGDDQALAENLLMLLDQPPAPALLREAASPYEIESATSAFLKTLNLPDSL